jgi:sugar/nucleoside kinase (ribokinase family)
VTGRLDRLVHVGSVVVDVVLDVPALPARGDDVLARATQVTAGGGFNVMAAAAAQGLAVAYAGAYGSGPFAALARAALDGRGIEVLQPPKPGADTGFVVAIVEAGGERTFLTSRGAESELNAGDLRGVRPGPRDAVYLSGYGLLDPGAAAIADWAGRLDAGTEVFLDPGPLIGDVPGDVLDPVLSRTDWLTCNAREASRMTGKNDPAAAARALAGVLAGRRGLAGDGAAAASAGRGSRPPAASAGRGSRPPARQRGGIVVRTGAAGCLLVMAGDGDQVPVRVPGFRVTAVDTTGAGDTHCGTFIAALARGADAVAAARTANGAAALSVTRPGPATAPTAAELERWLSGSRRGSRTG